MPSQLYNNDNVSFVCGRNFTYAGESFTAGDDFPQEILVSNIETLVRTRHLIPVVDDLSVKPRHWHREVRQKDIVLKKLGIEPKGEDSSFDPEDHTVEEVLEHVEENPEKAGEVLEAEEEGKDRKGVVEPLEEIADQFHPDDHNMDEVLEYLTSDIDEEEYERVMDEERNGKARKGILGEEE